MWEYRNQHFNYFASIFSLSSLFINQPDYFALPRFSQTNANGDNYRLHKMLDRSQRDVTLFKATVYLQGFNKSNGAIRSASVLYHRSSKALYRIKAYITGYLNISLVFQEIEFPSLPRSRSFKV